MLCYHHHHQANLHIFCTLYQIEYLSNLLLQVNLIIVSDHGMDSTSSRRQEYLDDYIDSSSYFLTEWEYSHIMCRQEIIIAPR